MLIAHVKRKKPVYYFAKRTFLLLCLLLGWGLCYSACASELYRVIRVLDGDTVVLSDTRKVRLLGINTPEMGYRGKPNEPGASRAKEYLKSIVLNKEVMLEQGVEQKDKYERTLAHIFLQNKQHINLTMIESGLATLSLHPPNIKYSKELVVAQKSAEKSGLGLWSMSKYAVRSIDVVSNKRATHWGRFNGNVIKISLSKQGAKLWLNSETYIWIGASHESYFPKLDTYKGQRIEVRGWPRKWGKYWSIRAIHPSQIIKYNKIDRPLVVQSKGAEMVALCIVIPPSFWWELVIR
jgi:endonuclease YncB( thermonuclease family)